MKIRVMMLELYDYGTRFYDPAIGRWHSIDPFAEKYFSSTPYSYVESNPIKFIDVNGDYIYINDEDGNRYKYDQGQLYSRNDDGDWVEYTAEEGSLFYQQTSTYDMTERLILGATPPLVKQVLSVTVPFTYK